MTLGEKIISALRCPIMIRMRSAKQYVALEVELIGTHNANQDLFGLIIKRIDGVPMVIMWDQIESLENFVVEQQTQQENSFQ